MQNIIVTLLIIFNIFGIFILLKMTKGKEIVTRIILTISLIILNYIILNVIYKIASIGVDSDVTSASKIMLIFAFMPINLVAIASPIAIATNEKKMEAKKNIILRNVIITIIILVFEIIALKNIQIGIEDIRNKRSIGIENDKVFEDYNNVEKNNITNTIIKDNITKK